MPPATLPRPGSAFRWTDEPWGPALRASSLEPIVRHVFTSRSLGLARGAGPDAASWAALASSVGVGPARVMRVKQVHGSGVRVLERNRVGREAAAEVPAGDAIVSNEPGLALVVLVADCVPILLVDPVRGAAGAVHAGWRGTCARVVQAAVARMAEAFGTAPADLAAAIGPSIGPDDYEVGQPLVDAFRAAGHPAADLDRWFVAGGGGPRLRLDLWRASRDQLVAAGLRPERVHVCGLSTLAHPGVFESYRRDGEAAGRMAAAIVVPES